MTNNPTDQSFRLVPFLFQFAEPLPQAAHQTLRYDAQRQISQALVNGGWVDAPDMHLEGSGHTRLTRVRAETTDDA